MTDTELTKMLRSSANGVVNYAADRIEQLTAERDRLQEALWAIWACETPNANATVTRMVAIAKAALKGETP